MATERVNLIHCSSCRVFYSYEKEDIDIIAHGHRYRVSCPECRTANGISAALFAKLYPNGKPSDIALAEMTRAAKDEVQEEVQEKRRDIKREKMELALEAVDVVKTEGGIKNAASKLGITQRELRERMKHLPPTEAVVEASS